MKQDLKKVSLNNLEREMHIPLAMPKEKDLYKRYFGQLERAFNYVLEFYRTQRYEKSHGSDEEEISKDYFLKILQSISALRLKYLFNQESSLQVDVRGSGLPGFNEINDFELGKLQSKGKLEEIPSMDALKQAMLDHIFQTKKEPYALIHQACLRLYYGLFSEDKLFFPFTSGKLYNKVSSQPEYRSYVYSWGCYDFATNRPYIHLMTFYQDLKSQALDAGGQNFADFLDTVKLEGSRAPDVKVLAYSIDESLADIHPKVIKRICVGPLCSRDAAHEPAVLYELLDKYGQMDDFIFVFEDEIVISTAQRITRGTFSPWGRIREVFMIPDLSLNTYQRQMLNMHKHVIMPHNVLQHMNENILEGCVVVTYNKNEEGV